MCSSRGRRPGSALIVVLGVLVVLSVFAIAFARLSSLERDVANSYTYQTQARFVAEAGMEAALQRLERDYPQVLVDGASYPWTYGDAVQTPIELSTRPSYGKDSLGNDQTISVDGVVYGYSGQVVPPPAMRLATDGSHYALKIIDSTSRLNVNDANPNLARMLDYLGEAIPLFTGNPNPVRGRGAQIVAFRDALSGGRLASVAELRRLPGFTSAELDLLTQYVTVHGWQDRVLVPRPFQGNALTSAISYAYATTLRTPVNVNTAPGPVLYALFRNVSARCLFPAGGTYAFANSRAIDGATARRIADAIVARRGSTPARPVYSIHDLAALVDSLMSGNYEGYMPILMACLNPSAKLTKFNPDWSQNVYGLTAGRNVTPHGRAVICDKADLTYYTTEVCFASRGYFEITSLGRLVDEDRTQILATYKILQTVKTFDVRRHSTQQDFERNVVGGPRRARSYPENMPDQRDNGQPIDWRRGSALDGQIALDDRETNRGGTTWWTDSDTKFQHFSQMNGRWSSLRWPSGIRHQGQAIKSPDLRSFRPLYSMEGNAARPQSPYERSLLNESQSPNWRTSDHKSDLHPDGFWFNHYNTVQDPRWREQEFDSVDHIPVSSTPNNFTPRSGNAIFHPGSGRAEYWIKPDTRYKTPTSAIDALLRLFVFDNNAPAPWSGWGSGPANHMLGVVEYQGNWIVYNTQRSGVAGTVSSLLRRPVDWSYPRDNYIYSDYWRIHVVPDIDRILRPMQWNHVRVNWFYVNLPFTIRGRNVAYAYQNQLWVNGQLLLSASGSSLYSWWFGYYMITPGYNLTGRMQFPYFDMNPMPPAGWPTGRNTCTVDQLRMGRVWSAGLVNHYNPTNGWSWWRGRFDFGKDVRIHSIRYEENPGRPTDGAVIRSPSFTQLQWVAGNGPPASPGPLAPRSTPFRTFLRNAPPAVVVDQTSDTLDYVIYFFDNGQRPFTQSPFVDDVTVYYSDGPLTILDRLEGI